MGYFDNNGNWVANGFGYDPTPSIPTWHNGGMPPIQALASVIQSYRGQGQKPDAPLVDNPPIRQSKPQSRGNAPSGRPAAPKAPVGGQTVTGAMSTAGLKEALAGVAPYLGVGNSNYDAAAGVAGTTTNPWGLDSNDQQYKQQVYAQFMADHPAASPQDALTYATQSMYARKIGMGGGAGAGGVGGGGSGGGSGGGASGGASQQHAAQNVLNNLLNQYNTDPYAALRQSLITNTNAARQQGADALTQLQATLAQQKNPYAGVQMLNATETANPLQAYMNASGASTAQNDQLTQFLHALSQNAVNAQTNQQQAMSQSFDNFQQQRVADANTAQAAFDQQLAANQAASMGNLDMQRQKYQADLMNQMQQYAAKYGLQMPKV